MSPPDLGTYLYPWDVVGDPVAADRVAALGVRRASVAAAYHAARALTPRHPCSRVVTAAHAAVYYPVDAARWRGRRLRPVAQTWCAGDDPFGEAAAQLDATGIAVDAWVVVAHNALLGRRYPDVVIRNAYGDRYPWALCIARAEVVEYARSLAAEAATRPRVAGVELESCGWYGFAHLSSHDKTAGVQLERDEEVLLSLCFCETCSAAYAAAGIAVDDLRNRVAAALDCVFSGRGSRPGLPAELSAAVSGVRQRAAERLLADVVSAIREEAPGVPVLLHADPRPEQTGAFVGVDPRRTLELVDGLVVAEALVSTTAAVCGDGRIVANLNIVAGMAERLHALATRLDQARRAGATGFRFYHAGIASNSDLDALAATVSLR